MGALELVKVQVQVQVQEEHYEKIIFGYFIGGCYFT